VDLVGLVTNGSALPHRAGQGSVLEWLEQLPSRRRPTHFAIFPDWFPYLRQTSLVGRKLAQFVLGENTISGADVKSVYEADWSHVGGAEQLWLHRELLLVWGFRVQDELDVADLRSQSRHDYEAFDTWRDTLREFPVAGEPERVFLEGGRQPTRGERFLMRCRPGVPGALVMRTEAFRDFRLEVRVNGTSRGLWEIPRASLVWSELLFDLPGEAFTGDVVLFELTQPEGELPYPSFHYWLIQ
jgi:hypothetical protein